MLVIARPHGAYITSILPPPRLPLAEFLVQPLPRALLLELHVAGRPLLRLAAGGHPNCLRTACGNPVCFPRASICPGAAWI
jgi:hypothetical protein